MLVQIEVPVSNKYSVRIECAKSDNLAIYLTASLTDPVLLPGLGIDPDQQSPISSAHTLATFPLE